MIWQIYAVVAAFVLGAAAGSAAFYIFLRASTFTQIDSRLELLDLQGRMAEMELAHEMEQGDLPWVH